MCDPDDMQRRHVTDDHTVVFSHLNLRQYAALLYREQVKGEHRQTFRELSQRWLYSLRLSLEASTPSLTK